MKKQHITLSATDREVLTILLKKGHLGVKQYKRATGLLELDRGKSLTAVAATLGVSYVTVSSWRDGYRREGVTVLYDKPRSGRPIEIDGSQRAKITALACSEAPAGHARWDLRLLADKAVELGYCAHLSHTQARTILKKTLSNRT
ncbi:MAG: helix-turn-helix domain containing protein [Candidatus Competibacteraceae bacterium]|nr:helix-turn-helix domain containing protein [Candidatus Competibacteraceae bacterium]